MPKEIHFHASLENVILYGVSAIIVIDVLGIAAAKMAQAHIPAVAKMGEAIGAIVPFKG